MNPETPAGLPYGDKAVLVQVDNYPDGLVFFIDGDKACTPMRAPPELLALIQEVAAGKINHPGPVRRETSDEQFWGVKQRMSFSWEWRWSVLLCWRLYWPSV